MEMVTESAEETQKLGEELANRLAKGKIRKNIICLFGDLGSGKTTFVQGLAKGLGIKKRILSPTFVMMRIYRIGEKREKTGEKDFPRVSSRFCSFYHLDLYRAEGERDVEALGLEEIWQEPGNLLIIEWPEKIEKILPKERIEVRFEYLEGERRRIEISD